ncbi:MAG TPA: GNAT family N-acetyltransferase [Kribbella sp.]|uniref:GNAT family N-acetyltransferase n=1 Tax=Kribbella sp. TaxID=1871183 RepID=UPI002D779A0A|nr:GNAT family N-acetyltransferase [Kribbella sp.]HET6298798.1 GNAT family N-acetyltransferase [Kribbella sp.]
MSTPPPVTLRPLTEEEFAEWSRRAAESFAAGMGPSRGLDPATALEVAWQETAKLLPDGRDTESQLIWMACDEDEPIGSLWISTQRTNPYIYSIEVNEGRRGKGYGRSIMLAGEEECRRRGYAYLDLNVFGTNGTAIGLYDSLGYVVTSQQMRKTL